MTDTRLHTAQNTGETPSWVSELYACFDRMDLEAMLAHFSEDARIRFGNAEPTVGLNAFRATSDAFLGTIAGTAHRFTQVWECGESAMLLAEVEYTCRNGKVLCLPAATALHRRPDGLIDDMQVFVDVSPLFAP
ncbi:MULTISPECIES: nuclear transport factor 2 family protein [Streptomyces]|uniref:nuclear transport factor 2 family protein n=1 Tax=Streptomyces lycopersici TaxID=2974589 RepID=UPI0021D09881|nr:nuclear transport factor 2 family protein [Streptomyces sp. NEAU-383]